MNQQASVLPSQALRRRDCAMSADIDAALALQQRCNSVCAIEYLRARNVNSAIISRVLLEPEQRRH